MGKITLRNHQYHDKRLLWIAGGIGFLGSISANFIWEYTSKNFNLLTAIGETKFWIGLICFIGFLLLFWGLSKGYGKID